MPDITQKTVLIAPLDWGLGHATRCMPLIDLLLKKKHRVLIAGNGDAYYLLKEQYPFLEFFELPGYHISYPAGKNAAIQGLLQTPKILKTIRAENVAIKKIAQNVKIDLIISDNRYGVRHPQIKSIFVCHHIALQAPKGFGFMNPIFLRLHLQQFEKFDALWIPDEEGNNNLSGKLSHGIPFKIPHAYIGIQSRFSGLIKTRSPIDGLDFSILAVLSGPEPQRSIVEEKLKEQLKKISQKALLVRGKPEKYTLLEEDNITIIPHLNASDLYAALEKASYIICRSGYSSVMDLAVLGKKAIFIPAEGQTEQEYLAEMLAEKRFGIACTQKNPDIEDAIRKLETIPGFPVYQTTKKLETELDKVLSE